MKQGTKSLTLSAQVGNGWTWKPRPQRQAMQVPVAGGGIGLMQNYGLQFLCFAVTLTLSSVRPAPQLVTAPASVLVDARGQQLQVRP